MLKTIRKGVLACTNFVLFLLYIYKLVCNILVLSSNVSLSEAKGLSSRKYETLTCTPEKNIGTMWRAAQVSVAKNPPSHCPEAVSLRERDIVFLR